MIINLDLATELYKVQSKTEQDHSVQEHQYLSPETRHFRLTWALLANYRRASQAQAQLVQQKGTKLQADSFIFFRTWDRAMIIENLCIGRFTAAQLGKFDIISLSDIWTINKLLLECLFVPDSRGDVSQDRFNAEQYYIGSLKLHLHMRVNQVLQDVLFAAYPDWSRQPLDFRIEGVLGHLLRMDLELPKGLTVKDLVPLDKCLRGGYPYLRHALDIEGHIVE